MLRSFAHPVAFCWDLLRKFWIKPVKVLSQQLPTFLLFRGRRSLWTADAFPVVASLFFWGRQATTEMRLLFAGYGHRSVEQPCWIRLHRYFNIDGAKHAHLTVAGLLGDSNAITSRDRPTPWWANTVGSCCISLRKHPFLLALCRWRNGCFRRLLLHPYAHHWNNNSQHCLPNNVGSCRVRLHVTYGDGHL